MNVPFPPPPPGAGEVILARWILVGLTVLGAAILSFRIWNWKTVRRREIAYWLLLGLVSAMIAPAGYSNYSFWNNNNSLYALIFLSCLVNVAGIGLCLTKAYANGAFRLARVAEIGLSASVIVVLVALLLPAVHRGRPAGARVQCKNNLKQIGLALHNYEQKFHRFPRTQMGDPPMSWRVSLLPYLDQAGLANGYFPERAWDQIPNDSLAREGLPQFSCPSNYWRQDQQGRYFTGYSIPTGSHTVGSQPDLKIAQIVDGTSHTILAVEACGAEIVWTEPRDVDFDMRPLGINLPGDARGMSAGWMSAYHTGGAHLLLADGSIRFVSSNIDPQVLKNLATIDGGETIGDFD